MLLDGKNILIYGVRNDRSIGWGCAQALAREGARLALAYLGEREEKDVRKVASMLPNPDSVVLAPCDLTDDAQIASLHELLARKFDGRLDVMVHGVANAHREDLAGRFVDTSREGFQHALNVSAYSFVAAAHAALPLMKAGGSMITLTYLGSERVVPNYNVMGVAKAALESSVRYLAADLGRDGIRVNAVSSGPAMTISARGISGFADMYRNVPNIAPLRRNTTIDEVGDMVVFLASDLSRGTTADVLFVDSGMHALAEW
jgi:enoyl-[acyl-carrier protein] reductase I